jgi:DNA-binding NtrC family response regulator
LENAVERAFVLSGVNIIRDADLPPEITAPLCSNSSAPGRLNSSENPIISIPPSGFDMDAHLHDLEKACYEEAIRRKDGNREAAARLLGIQPHTFRKRAKEKFGL